ncbi:rhodanese-like domain-containing protein [Reichenbachiella ulvae]|uniref:Rhodanese-like domain-containing protein n=1 Tax=Reichenbachiella ulvae TaxID=2980104 RepID=A0ABT3CRC1_9BACT|nr:rhodanese-like domain-containing protein [Reichenbachiella ulvae]MCV9386162.1 rhodanese-like domain-containing protein [Reichenbachiella ulvae]
MISAEELNEVIQNDENAIVLDLRTDEEIADGMLEGATQLNFHDPEFNDKLQALDKSKTYYVYCRSGGRSGKAAGIMKESGFKAVYDLEGGIASWKAKDLPLVVPN